jgi:hypothetical protein
MYQITFRNTMGSVWRNPPKSASTSEDSEPENIILGDFNFQLFSRESFYPRVPYPWVFHVPYLGEISINRGFSQMKNSKI